MMDGLLQGAIVSAQRYLSNRSDVSLLIQLENRLESLNAVSQDWATSHTSVDAQWTDENLMLVEWFSYCCSLLTPPDPPPISLSSKIIAFLYDFAWYCYPARQYFQSDLSLSSTLSLVILRNVDGQGHRNFKNQCLKLLQVVTYNLAAVGLLPNVSSDLLQYLVKVSYTRIDQGAAPDQVRYALGILNNLCSSSGSVVEHIKKSDKINDLCRNLLLLLNDSNRDVVVNCLSLIMLLDNTLKNKVYSNRNLPRTFECAFNVLLKGDQFMARHYAVDLFSQMVVDNGPIRQALAAYESLELSMTCACSLLVSLDTKREPLYKVYELLLRFCKIDLLRQPTCRALVQAGPVDDRLISPLIAVTECARLPIEHASFPDLPTRAMKLLRNVVEEVVGSQRIADHLATDVLLGLIEDCLKATIETGRPLLAAHKSKRIVQCLRLASAASRDDPEFRTDLLEVITPALCGHLAEFQMLSNPIVTSFASIVSTGMERQLTRSDIKQVWHGVGAQILFTLIDFLRLMEQYSKNHRDQYWKLLKDARVVPFLAYGLTSQNKKMVRQAFQIAMTMAQDEEFPDSWLSELIAQNIKNLRQAHTSNGFHAAGFQNGCLANGIETKSIGSNGSITAGAGDPAMIDDLIATVKSNLNVQDAKISQVMEVYERKIAIMEAKERQLQEVLHARTSALQQSDRLLNQYRLNRGDVEQETTKLRALLRETELKSEQTTAQLAVTNSECDKIRAKAYQMEQRMAEKEKELDACRELDADNIQKMKNLTEAVEATKTELESEKDLHSVLRKHYDKMKMNFDTTYSKLTEAENELKQLKKVCKEQEASLKAHVDKIEELKASNSSKDEEIGDLEKSVEKLQDALQAADKEKKQLRGQFSEMEHESNRKSGLIKEQEQALQRMQEEIATYAKILESMHKLSSKAVGKN